MTSKLEQMAYKMQPAGHEEQPQKRKNTQPRSKLAEIFEKWLKEAPSNLDIGNFNTTQKLYKGAEAALTGLKPSLEELHGLLLGFADHPHIQAAGFFLSATYNTLTNKEIVYDLPIELSFLGCNLSASKILVVKSQTGTYLGEKAQGPIVNLSETGHFAGSHAEAPLINYGVAGASFGSMEKSVSINYGKTLHDFNGGPVAINLGITGAGFGSHVTKFAINYGVAGEEMASSQDSGDMAINCGKAGKDFGKESPGILIAIKAPRAYSDDISNLLLKPEDCKKIPKLARYFEKLRTKLEEGRNDYHKAIRIAKQLNVSKLEREIGSILKEAGYEWMAVDDD